MASEDSVCLSASQNSNDLGSNNLSVDVLGNAVGHIEDGVFIMEDIGPLKENQRDHTTANDTVNVHEKRGVKRVLEECNNTESSVRVVFSSLPSRSKRKLDEFLSQWSDWHAKQCASVDDSADSLESGEETYFPALQVGSDKMSTVSFSMDVPVLKRQRKESAILNQECTPVYDRGFAVGLATDTVASEASGVDLREAPRCFNCGSYNHPLSGCTKPFNKDAVNSARKEFQSKRNQNSNNPRVPTRYYQDSPAGKFDGLTPGSLSAETRKVLSLGELDPPPWLNRMRELGYPPGYLGAEEDDEPSGITIFDDSETYRTTKRNSPPLGLQQSQNNMTINFPGINSPIPKNADHILWANRDLSPPFPRHSYENPFDFSRNQQHNYRQNFVHGMSPPFSFGSPPVSQRPYDYHQSEPFSPIGLGLPIPASPRYGRPFMHHYSHGSF